MISDIHKLTIYSTFAHDYGHTNATLFKHAHTVYLRFDLVAIGEGVSPGTSLDPCTDTDANFRLFQLAGDAPVDACDERDGADCSGSEVPLEVVPLPLLGRRTKSKPECSETAKGDDEG